jgi:hypothetical protein
MSKHFLVQQRGLKDPGCKTWSAGQSRRKRAKGVERTWCRQLSKESWLCQPQAALEVLTQGPGMGGAKPLDRAEIVMARLPITYLAHGGYPFVLIPTKRQSAFKDGRLIVGI